MYCDVPCIDRDSRQSNETEYKVKENFEVLVFLQAVVSLSIQSFLLRNVTVFHLKMSQSCFKVI